MMKNTWKYVLIILLGLALGFFIALPVLGWLFGSRYGMGPWMMGPFGGFGHMGGFGMFGGLMVLGMVIFPVLLIVGAVALVLALVRGSQNTGQSSGPGNVVGTHPCRNCGKYVQNDWVSCPYCGQNLKE